MSRILPALVLAVGLCGTFASAVTARPLLVTWAGVSLILAGVFGIEEGKEGR